MKMKAGFDWGTTNSTPATVYLDQNIILLPGGKYGIPSVFYYSDWDGVLIGEEAERAGQGTEAKNLKREIKLELDSSFTADGKVFSAKQIVSHILAFIAENALNTAKEKMIADELEGVVISVPAEFGHNEKTVIKEAAEMPIDQGGPGLNVLGFIKEPVAAALSYYKTSLEDKTKVLVYDLGGGTCDIAIVEADSSVKEKYSVIDSGMLRIGGKNWDEKLESYILHEVEKISGKSVQNNPGNIEKIKREAIIVKHAFSEKIAGRYRDKVKAHIEIDGRTYQIPITREIFDELTYELFEHTVSLVRKVLDRNDSGSISRMICVGGGSKMPQVQEGLRRIFSDKNIQVYEPEKAIAIGAAIYAQQCDGKDSFLSDIAAFSYGTECCRDYDNDPDDKIVVNNIIKGDRLPITRKHSFATIKNNQRNMYFHIIENTNVVEAYDYEEGSSPHIMDVVLSLPPNMPKGYSAVLNMTLTIDGMLEVTADDNNGRKITAHKQLFF